MIKIGAAVLAFCTGLCAAQSHAQSPMAVPPSANVGKRLEFEVASVRPNKSDNKGFMNVNPTGGDNFTPTGGLYVARNIVLVSYISFSYKLTMKQLQSVVSQVPWITEDRFDIEARAEGNPTKDQYRQMMQSLLADRFKLRDQAGSHIRVGSGEARNVRATASAAYSERSCMRASRS